MTSSLLGVRPAKIPFFSSTLSEILSLRGKHNVAAPLLLELLPVWCLKILLASREKGNVGVMSGFALRGLWLRH